MRKFPRVLRQIFKPVTPRSSVIERGLALSSILAAVVLAVMALVVHRVNMDAAEASTRSIRSIEALATLDKLQLSLRDGDVIARDFASNRFRDGTETDRFDNARFQARLNLAALGPLAGDGPDQAERLSRLAPLINQKFTSGIRGYDASNVAMRDQIDALIAMMRADETRRLDEYRSTQRNASEKSTWIMVLALSLVTILSLVFWFLLKVEFAARRSLEQRLIESATMDELTGVANRSDFDQKLTQEWAFKDRYATALSLIVIDVDHLKEVNETWGHVAGDKILREVARRLSSRLKRTDLLARAGGDEFAVIVPQYRKEALVVAEQLRERVAEAPFLVEGSDRRGSVAVTVSVGVAASSEVDSSRGLLVAAEEAMYGAKQKGRNRVNAYQADPTSYTMRPATTKAEAARTTATARTTGTRKRA